MSTSHSDGALEVSSQRLLIESMSRFLLASATLTSSFTQDDQRTGIRKLQYLFATVIKRHYSIRLKLDEVRQNGTPLLPLAANYHPDPLSRSSVRVGETLRKYTWLKPVEVKVYFLTEAARASTRDKVLITAWHPRSQSDPGSGTTSHLVCLALVPK